MLWNFCNIGTFYLLFIYNANVIAVIHLHYSIASFSLSQKNPACHVTGKLENAKETPSINNTENLTI